MNFIIGLVIGLVVGFVAGFLVFRKHQKKINAAEIEAEVAVGKLKDVVEDIKGD